MMKLVSNTPVVANGPEQVLDQGCDVIDPMDQSHDIGNSAKKIVAARPKKIPKIVIKRRQRKNKVVVKKRKRETNDTAVVDGFPLWLEDKDEPLLPGVPIFKTHQGDEVMMVTHLIVDAIPNECTCVDPSNHLKKISKTKGTQTFIRKVKTDFEWKERMRHLEAFGPFRGRFKFVRKQQNAITLEGARWWANKKRAAHVKKLTCTKHTKRAKK
jgi:hypothetical protein